MLLQARGFLVRTASDGWSGLKITDNEPIDAVILDYKMPGIDGEEVAKRLRARHPHIPILLLSGFHGLIPDSLFSMVDGFLQKGSPAAQLISEVERLTGTSVDSEAQERKQA